MLSSKLIDRLSSAKAQATALTLAQRQARNTAESAMSFSNEVTIDGSVEQNDELLQRSVPSLPKFQLNSPPLRPAATSGSSSPEPRPQTARRILQERKQDGSLSFATSNGATKMTPIGGVDLLTKHEGDEHQSNLLPPPPPLPPQFAISKPRYEWKKEREREREKAKFQIVPQKPWIRLWRSFSPPSRARSLRRHIRVECPQAQVNQCCTETLCERSVANKLSRVDIQPVQVQRQQ